jgi:hypothetical protein
MFAHFDRTTARSALVMFEIEQRFPKEQKCTVWAIKAQKKSPRNRLNAFRVGFCCGALILLDSTNEGDLDMMV